MRSLKIGALLLLVASPLVAQDTLRGSVGSTVPVLFTVDSLCRRVVKLSPSGTFLERKILCPSVVVPPVEPPVPVPTAWFRSDWSTGTILDGKWTEARNNTQDLAVVPAAGLGFPAGMKNVLRHTFPGNLTSKNGRAAFVALIQGLPQLAIDQTLYGRFYFRADYPNTATADANGSSHHNFEGDNAGSVKSVISFHPGNATNGTYPVWWDAQGVWPFDGWYVNVGYPGTALTKGVVYRWEFALTRVKADTVTVKFWLYGADDRTLLYPDPQDTTQTRMVSKDGKSTLRTYRMPLPNVDWLRSWELGNNGWSGASWSADAYDYFGGVCFRNSRPGPYSPTC